MRKRQQTFRHNIRFRFWRRKGYAAFASLGVCVTIGQLRKNVTERALRKQLSPEASVCMRQTAEETWEHETETPPVITLLQELLQPIPPISVPAPPSPLINFNQCRDALCASCIYVNNSYVLTKLRDAHNASLHIYNSL